ncbi:MAG: hypothetical protein E6560_00410 [Yersiniaceae bacterium]|nr:hypothetical protein [Yersiniaceae bacterium]
MFDTLQTQRHRHASVEQGYPDEVRHDAVKGILQERLKIRETVKR